MFSRLFLIFILWTGTLSAMEVKIREGLKVPEGMTEKILEAAKAKHQGEIKSIEIFGLSAGPDYGVGFVVFEQEIGEREATTFTYQSWFHFSDGKIYKDLLQSSSLAVFPLKNTKVIFQLNETTPYDSVLALLQAIEREEILVDYSDEVSHEGNRVSVKPSPVQEAIPKAVDLPKVFQVRLEPKTGVLTVMVHSKKSSGETFGFKQEGDRFRCVSSGNFWF